MNEELKKFVDVLNSEQFKDDVNLGMYKHAVESGMIQTTEQIFTVLLQTIKTLETIITNSESITINIDDYEKGVDLAQKINNHVPIEDVRNKLGHIASLLDIISLIDTDKDIPFTDGNDYSTMFWQSFRNSNDVLDYYKNYETVICKELKDE